MTSTVPMPNLSKEFNAFLYAAVCEEKNGMLLSVLSALARLDIDPWQEAANLAGLPEGAAEQRLTTLIETLPKGVAHLDAGTTAARLVQLLPCHAKGGSASGQSEKALGVASHRPLLFYAMILMFVFSSQFMGAKHQSQAPVDTASALASNSAMPKELPSSIGH